MTVVLTIFLTQRRKGAAVFVAPLRRCVSYFFLATAFTSDSSITGAGPEMPPSFLMRQK
jgi:hypothetical protein